MMAITTQGKVTAPNVAYPGDPYGTSYINQALVQGGNVTGGGIKIGTFCWGVSGTNNVTQVKGDSIQLAGFVYRSQSNPMPWDAVYAGASLMINDGQTVAFVAQGTFYAEVTSLNSDGSVNPNDKVYVRMSDGVTCVSTNAPDDSIYYNTGWEVTKNNPTPVNYGIKLAVISNQQTFN